MTKGETTTQENLLQTLFKLEAENERLHDALDKIRAEIEAYQSDVKATRRKLYELLDMIEPQDGEEVITNQKWLALISPEEWVRVIHWLYHDYGTRFADSEGAIIQWLRQDMRKEQSNE